MNSILAIPQNTTLANADENNYLQLNNQAISFLIETNITSVHLKPLSDSHSGKFYSYEYCVKKMENYSKILNIITETVSEVNQRYSSFLIAELTTST
jgi:hypothetical protein